MSLVLAAVHGQQAFVVSDGAMCEFSPDGSELRRCCSDAPKFRDVGHGMILAATGIEWLLERVYANVRTLIQGDRAVAIDDVARFLAANLPAWDRDCEARFARLRRVGRDRGGNAIVAILGYDASQSRARCVGFRPADGFRPHELIEGVAFGVETGLDLRPIARALRSGAPRKTILRLMQKAVSRVASQDNRVGGQIFSVVVDPSYVSPPAVRPNTDTATDTATPVDCQRAINGGSTWTTISTVGLVSSFNITRQTTKQTVIVQGVNAADGAFGNQTTVEIDAFETPTVSQLDMSVDTNGAVGFTVNVPVGTNSFKWLISTSATPSDASVLSSGTLENHGAITTWTVNGATTLSFGQTAYLRVIPFSGASATGTQFPSIDGRAAYLTYTATKTANFSAANFTQIDPPLGSTVDNATFDSNVCPNCPDLAIGNPLSIAMNILLPAGVTITSAAISGSFGSKVGGSVGSYGILFLRQVVGGAATSLGSASLTYNGGAQTATLSMSETTGASSGYTTKITWTGAMDAGQSKATGVAITYTMPDPKKTL